MKVKLSLVAGLLIFAFVSPALCFTFSEDGQEEAQQKAVQQEKIRRLLSIPCQEKLKKKKIALMIGEQHAGGEMVVEQSNYGLLFEVINRELREIGLSTYTQEEITRQIAQEEIRASMNNDPDAALSAARRLGAQFILRGLISSRAQVNPVLNINEVFVNMSFTLTHASGRTVTGVTASADSYAGADVLSVALTLVEEQADEVVARLYHEFCEYSSGSLH